MKEQNEKMDSLKKQSVWLLFAKTIGFALTFLLPLLTVRYLSQTQVGVYRQSFQVIINAIAILPIGFGMSAYYFLSRGDRSRRSMAVFNILIFNFLVGGLACLALFLSPQLLGNIFQSAEMTRLAPKIGVVIWLWIFSTFLETVAVANRETRTATIFIISAQLTKTALMAGAVIIFATVEAFLYAAMIQAVGQTIVLLFYLNSRFPGFWRGFDARFFLEQFIYALPLGLAGLLWTLQTDVHTYFVGYRFSEAEYAIYVYGCFQLPLIAMLSESVNSVLIPRVSELEAQNDKREMIRLTMQTMKKLALVYFPLYVFLLITAQTFITAFFTRDYAASVPIFLINLTLLPFGILITDPLFRAFKRLGVIQLVSRVFTVLALVAALYFAISRFDLRGIIAIVVAATLIDKFILSFFAARNLNVRARDILRLGDIGKTAVASLAAGAVTFLFYRQLRETIFGFGASLTQIVFSGSRPGVTDLFAGGLVLVCSAFVFAPIYFLCANYFNLIETGEKEKLKSVFLSPLKKLFGQRKTADRRPLTTEH